MQQQYMHPPLADFRQMDLARQLVSSTSALQFAAAVVAAVAGAAILAVQMQPVTPLVHADAAHQRQATLPELTVFHGCGRQFNARRRKSQPGPSWCRSAVQITVWRPGGALGVVDMHVGTCKEVHTTFAGCMLDNRLCHLHIGWKHSDFCLKATPRAVRDEHRGRYPKQAANQTDVHHQGAGQRRSTGQARRAIQTCGGGQQVKRAV